MITLFEDWQKDLEYRKMLYSRKYIGEHKWDDDYIYPEIGKVYKVIDINRPWNGDGYFKLLNIGEYPGLGGLGTIGLGFWFCDRNEKSIQQLFQLGSKEYSFHLANEDGIKIYSEKMDPEKFGI